MATLKICAAQTCWISNVKTITTLGAFCLVPPTSDAEAIPQTFHERVSESAMDLLANAKTERGPLHVHSVEFNAVETAGVAVIVDFAVEAPEIWLFPRDQAFLMSDTGATIDRI